MDSLTQLALGAAVGEATAGRQVGRRAPLWGAICGTLPDLDVFVPFGDPVRDFTYHRSATHSLLVLAALTPIVVWVILKWSPATREHRTRWLALVYLTFATHVLLDSCTVYGTQIFWPLSTTPQTWSTIFIIDPLYTVPLVLGVAAALAAGRRPTWGHLSNAVALALSTGYLLWTVGAKLHVETVAQRALAGAGIAASDVLTTPTPFNTLLWRVLAVDDTSYYEGFYSLLDKTPAIDFIRRPRGLTLLEGFPQSWTVRRLQWFTKSFYAVQLVDDGIVIADLRMGLEPHYVFRFKVGETGNPHPRAVAAELIPGVRDLRRLRWVWARIWDRIDTT